jgi:hypothetical protein
MQLELLASLGPDGIARELSKPEARDTHFSIFKKTLDAPEIAAFIVTIAEHIPAILAADLIMAWVLGRFYDHGAEIESITIDETKITLSKSGKMRKIIRRKIKKERRR